MANYIHRKNAMLIEAAQIPKWNYCVLRRTNDIAQIFLHVDERNITEKFAIDRVGCARRKIDPHEIIEHQRLGGLCVLKTAVG
jgi:hypothetical protein